MSELGDAAKIFLATDNVTVQRRFSERYGADRVVWTEKWLPEEGDSIHKNSECPDGVRAARDALVDIGLLAACDRLVLTGNSSFSALAGWFSPQPESSKSLVFPRQGSWLRRLLGKVKRTLRHS